MKIASLLKIDDFSNVRAKYFRRSFFTDFYLLNIVVVDVYC